MNVENFVNRVVDMGVAGIQSTDLITHGKDSDWYSLAVTSNAKQGCEVKADVVSRNTVLVGLVLRVSAYQRSEDLNAGRDVIIEISYTDNRTKQRVEIQFKCEEVVALKNTERYFSVNGTWYSKFVTGISGEPTTLYDFLNEQEVELTHVVSAMSRSLFYVLE